RSDPSRARTQATPPSGGSAGKAEVRLVELLTVQALVPDALGVEPEHRSLAAVVTEPDHVAGRGRGLLLLRVTEAAERRKIPLVEQSIRHLFGCLSHSH